MSQHTLSVLVNNHPGLLSKVSGLFSRRSFNIDSLAVGICEIPDCSRMTIVVNGDESMVDQVIKQLDKLIDVIEIEHLPVQNSVFREMVLAKVAVEANQRTELLQIAEIFRAKIVDVSLHHITLELTGQADKINGFLNLLEDFKILRIVRTGTIAVPRREES
ncbi:MAG: acetolactate synthase small subunit [Clostridia bacterium]|nr:acetolactate synthase small subunit [Clostridia bacterium]